MRRRESAPPDLGARKRSGGRCTEPSAGVVRDALSLIPTACFVCKLEERAHRDWVASAAEAARATGDDWATGYLLPTLSGPHCAVNLQHRRICSACFSPRTLHSAHLQAQPTASRTVAAQGHRRWHF